MAGAECRMGRRGLSQRRKRKTHMERRDVGIEEVTVMEVVMMGANGHLSLMVHAC